MQARMTQITIEGEFDYNHDPMEEEINQDPTEESSQKPVNLFQGFLHSNILK